MGESAGVHLAIEVERRSSRYRTSLCEDRKDVGESAGVRFSIEVETKNDVCVLFAQKCRDVPREVEN